MTATALEATTTEPFIPEITEEELEARFPGVLSVTPVGYVAKQDEEKALAHLFVQMDDDPNLFMCFGQEW